jgi:hypothetical protein
MLEIWHNTDCSHPGVNVFGTSADDKEFTLANVELPCDCYPEDFTTRVFAGCRDYEPDGPIALVKNSIIGFNVDGTPMTLDSVGKKLIFIDEDYAEIVGWNNEPETCEHENDL